MIEAKSKKCKGTGQAKGYGCGEETIYRFYGLCKSKCYPEWLFKSDAGKVKMQKAIIKAQKPRKELEALKKESKERKGLTTLIKSVVKVCHEYIRKRDTGKQCISCGTAYKSDFDAGHFYPAGKFSTLKFNEFNINGQCLQCNRMNEGNESEYRINLPNRIGHKPFKELNYLAQLDKSNTGFKWDREELKKIRSYYKSKTKEL